MHPDFLYVGCPYTSSNPAVRRARFDMVTRLCAHLIAGGQAVYSPITSTHPLVRWGLAKDWEFWKKYDLPMMDFCGKGLLVYCMPGWGESVGLAAEIEYCEKTLHRPVQYHYLQQDEKDLLMGLIERYEDEMEDCWTSGEW